MPLCGPSPALSLLATAASRSPPGRLAGAYCRCRRGLSLSAPLRAVRPEKPATGASIDPQHSVAGPPIDAPRSYGKRVDGGFIPKPLPRPIGMPFPPKAGENTGLDHRTLSQRRADFVDYDKHLQRRRELTAQISRPYFRDWGNLRYHQGKSFVAPPCLFKADRSLFFPNLYGETLVKTDRAPRDTTPLLTGKVSVISIFSSMWAERQVASFVSSQANPALHAVVAQSDGLAQTVHVNYEDNPAKAFFIRLFRSSLRKRLPERDWDKYFLVRRGIMDYIRESVGLLNAKVGYTYLVDHHCRIRWAGSGSSHPEEVESLVKGLARLVDEVRKEALRPVASLKMPPARRPAAQPGT